MNDYPLAREAMVKEQLIPRGIKDAHVLAAMGRIPREMFVPHGMRPLAYEDRPLPINEEQTISQPYIVAEMTQWLALTGGEKVLEIGTGSGYQAAVLAELCGTLYTVERIEPLLLKARAVLEKLGYENIEYKVDDGTLGWLEHAPYDAIMVTAGAPEIPEPLMEQLAEDGRMVVPVGNHFSQRLIRVIRQNGRYLERDLGGVRFVPLKGDHGWKV